MREVKVSDNEEITKDANNQSLKNESISSNMKIFKNTHKNIKKIFKDFW